LKNKRSFFRLKHRQFFPVKNIKMEFINIEKLAKKRAADLWINEKYKEVLGSTDFQEMLRVQLLYQSLRGINIILLRVAQLKVNIYGHIF
jgi:hypothetical protein